MASRGDQNAQFGAWLKARRKALGLSRRELALRANCSEITIVKVEAGERRPSVQIAGLLAEALGIAPGEHSHFIEFARSEAGVPTAGVIIPGLPSGRPASLKGGAPGALLSGNPDRPALIYLPAPLTSFVGREDAVRAACEMLRRPEVRLLTLTGPPGIGKTRLGLRVAEEMAAHFGDGVYFAGLASIRDPVLVAGAVAGALRVRERAGTPLIEDLKERLRGKEVLLVLDNFEQLMRAAALPGELLTGSRGLKIIVSSREALRVYGEQVFPVHPLSLPPPGEISSPGELARYGAIQLFVERASAVEPGFRLSFDNGPLVLEICRSLEGVPLAIEIAAARLWDLTLQDLQRGLDHKLALLAEGPRDLPERQQTLRGAIDWSYELLDPQEQVLFRRLSIFGGGCAPGAVDRICGFDDSMGQNWWPRVSSLLNKSLLQLEARRREADREDKDAGGIKGEGWLEGEREDRNDDFRMSMVETIREYARERLNESGEAEELERLHAEYYLGIVEEAEPHLEAKQQVTWLDRLQSDHDNIRAALDHMLGARARSGYDEMLLRMAAALERFWEMRGYVSEGRRYLQHVLDNRATSGYSAQDTALRSRVLRAAGLLALYHGDMVSAGRLYEERLEIQRHGGDTSSLASALNDLGVVARAEANYSYARALYEESLKLRREEGDPSGIASSLNSLATLALAQGDLTRARDLAEESLRIRRQSGTRFGIALSLHNLGEIQRSLGNYAEAESLYTEYLHLSREMGDRPGIANALHNVGQVAHNKGELQQAEEHFRQALAMYKGWDDRPGIAECLAGLAEVAVSRNDEERATRLLGVVKKLIETTSFHFSPPDWASYEEALALLKARLDEREFGEWLSLGGELPLDQAVSYALGRWLGGITPTP